MYLYGDVIFDDGIIVENLVTVVREPVHFNGGFRFIAESYSSSINDMLPVISEPKRSRWYYVKSATWSEDVAFEYLKTMQEFENSSINA